MTSLTSFTLDAADTEAATTFYSTVLGLDRLVRVRRAEPTPVGFRGFTLSLLMPGPGDVDVLLDRALTAGAIGIKAREKTIWGYGGTFRAPDGAIWKVATSAKRDPGPVDGRVDGVVVLLGVESVPVSKRFYVERGLTIARSFGRVYAEFDHEGSAPTLALYRRRALAKDAGVPAVPAASSGLTLAARAAPFTDPDGFGWRTEHAAAGLESAEG